MASLAFQTVLAAPSAPPSCTNPVSLAVCCLPPLTGPPFSWLKSYSLDFPSCTKYVEQEVIFFSKSLGFLPSFSSWRVFVDRLVPSSLALLPSAHVLKLSSGKDGLCTGPHGLSRAPCAVRSGFPAPDCRQGDFTLWIALSAPFLQQESWLGSDQTGILSEGKPKRDSRSFSKEAI